MVLGVEAGRRYGEEDETGYDLLKTSVFSLE